MLDRAVALLAVCLVAAVLAMASAVTVSARVSSLVTARVFVVLRPGPAVERCTARRFSWLGGYVFANGPDAVPMTAIYGTPYPQIALIIGSDYVIEVFWRAGGRACLWAESVADRRLRLVVVMPGARVVR